MTRTNRTILIILVIILAFVATGCTSGLKIDQTGTTKSELSLTIDFNQNKLNQDTCDLPKGTSFTVGRLSYIQMGQERQPVIRLDSSHCSGWAYDDRSLLKVLEVKK